MTRRTLLLVAVTALATLGAACGGGTETTDGALPTRTVDAGAVEVTITPTRLGDRGATFDIALDTHSGDLSMDLATSAKLVVDGTSWPVDGWTGDESGGHHREGRLQFKPNGAARGTATLSLTGFPGPVEASWKLPDA